MKRLNRFGRIARCIAGLAALGTCGSIAHAQEPALVPPAPAVDGTVPETTAPIYSPVPEHAFGTGVCDGVVRYSSAAISGCQDDTYHGCECRPQGLDGCWRRFKAKQQHKWWGYADEFEEMPFGTYSQGILAKQVAKGQQARLALYHFDFVRNSPRLSPRGRARIAQLLPLLQNNYGALIIEEVPAKAQLNMARRDAVLAELTRLWPEAYPELVSVGRPKAAGLSGVDAILINQALMNRTTAGNDSSYGLNSGSTGFVADFGLTSGSRR